MVGLGVGGEFVAGRLAGAGLEVVGIESALVGGECPYWGCVPSKMIIRAANATSVPGRISTEHMPEPGARGAPAATPILLEINHVVPRALAMPNIGASAPSLRARQMSQR